MLNPLRPTLLLLLMAALMSSGCSSLTELREAGPEVSRVKPEDDPRYGLPPAQSRALNIFLDSQTFEYVEDDQVLLSGKVSTGTPQHPTPSGHFRVQSKSENKTSGKYTNYFNMPTPMPYSLQFHGPYFVHEGWVPDRPDSHGCVRLHYEDARLLFHRIRIGDPVSIEKEGVARVADPSPQTQESL
jgi:lipoprotein-anchoring transpeptidase ErfK/SrfK